MCGILGIVAPRGQIPGIDPKQAAGLRDLMARRGPDASGQFARENVLFAHRRLSIRDRSGGSQPWVSEDGRCVLVYNGELYNDASLRRELDTRGHAFRSRCDTEVVMAAYRQWGAECVERFRGMFALGIYDFEDERLLLARDRFGIKPLFLAECDGDLIFGSSIAAILHHPRFSRAPNFSVLSHYLTTLRLTLGRETVFEGIGQLLPAERLLGHRGEVRIERYWDYPRTEDAELTFDEAATALDSGLRDAVEKRLVSDVPVGMFLSGGVDSSTIAVYMREATGRRLPAGCGGGDDSPDFEFARACADHVRFDLDEVRLGPHDYLHDWLWMLEQYATPLSTPTDVILFRLSRAMKQSAGVILGGEGADELLCGYGVSHGAGYDYDLWRQTADNRWPHGGEARARFLAGLRGQYGRDHFASRVDHYFALNGLIPLAAKKMLLTPDAWQKAGQDEPMLRWYAGLLGEDDPRPTSAVLTEALHRVNLEALLSRLDSATMLASLEARVPFTDHRLVETMFRVPLHHKIGVAKEEDSPFLASGELERRGTLRSKRLLRAVADGLLPAKLARRSKASFPSPVARWLQGPWRNWAREVLLHSRFAGEMFSGSALVELADNIPQAGMWLWPMLNVILWGDRQFDRPAGPHDARGTAGSRIAGGISAGETPRSRIAGGISAGALAADDAEL